MSGSVVSVNGNGSYGRVPEHIGVEEPTARRRPPSGRRRFHRGGFLRVDRGDHPARAGVAKPGNRRVALAPSDASWPEVETAGCARCPERLPTCHRSRRGAAMRPTHLDRRRPARSVCRLESRWPPKKHGWDAKGIRDGVRVRWPPWSAGSFGVLPASMGYLFKSIRASYQKGVAGGRLG